MSALFSRSDFFSKQDLVNDTEYKLTPIQFKPYSVIENATIYNKNFQATPSSWFLDNADILVLLFTARNVDKDGIVSQFYEMYESAKLNSRLPIEVIYVPMDENKEDMLICFEGQGNWFTLSFDDPLVHTLKYMYEVTCIPHMVVMKPNGKIISSHGILDLEQYKKNALISWIGSSNSNIKERNLDVDAKIYGQEWRYMHKKDKQPKRYSIVDHEETATHTPKSNLT